MATGTASKHKWEDDLTCCQHATVNTDYLMNVFKEKKCECGAPKTLVIIPHCRRKLELTTTAITGDWSWKSTQVWLTWGFVSNLEDCLTAHFLPHPTSFWGCRHAPTSQHINLNGQQCQNYGNKTQVVINQGIFKVCMVIYKSFMILKGT